MIAVIGAGAFGTALAQVAARGGSPVLLWARDPHVAAAINDAHCNSAYLPGVPLSRDIRATADLTEVAEAGCWLLVTPAQAMRAVLEAAPRAGQSLVLCSKGIEEGTGKLLSDVAAELSADSAIGILSGPSFAHEVAAGLPTAVTFASADAGLREFAQRRLASPAFRIYASDDVIGAEVGGAVKNVLAIGCGVAEGAGLGQSARAALIARGYAEMARFAEALGARRETLSGLAGLGDLVLTCSSTSSRNYSLGFGIGQGNSPAALLADRRTVAEGAFTAPVLARLARETGVDMPIVDAVAALLAGRAGVAEVLDGLMARPPRAEGV